MRGSYRIGTIFGSDSLVLRTHGSTPFYSAGAIYPMGLPVGDYIVSSHIPPREMTDAWSNFDETEEPQPPQVGSLGWESTIRSGGAYSEFILHPKNNVRVIDIMRLERKFVKKIGVFT